MNEIEAAWLAGFLDGEGSFMVTRSTRAKCAAPIYEGVICATNTDRRLVEKCASLAGGKIITTTPKNPRHRIAHIWTLRGLRVGPTVEAVLPYLVGKREQAALVLQLRKMTKVGSPSGRNSTRKTPEEVAARAAIYNRVQALNRRGNPAYADMAERRIRGDSPLFAQVGT